MKTSRISIYALALAVAAAVLFVSPSAHSQSAVLQLMNGATTVTIADNSAMDSNSAIGIISFVGPVGDFETNVTTGTTKPVIGNATSPELALQSMDITNTSASTETITILFSDNNFGPAAGNPQAALSVTQLGPTPPSSNGSVTNTDYWDPGNTTLALTSLLTSIGPMTSLGAASDSGAFGTFGNPFALTQDLSITLNAGGEFLGSANFVLAVPEANGVVACVLVVLVLGVGLARRRLIKS